MRKTIFLLLLACIISACDDTGGSQQTLEAGNSIQGTQFAFVVASATVERDRLQITVEFMNRELDRAREMQISMISTLEERGINVVLPGVTSITPTIPPTPATSSTNVPPGQSVTPNAQIMSPSPAPQSIGLSDIIMSTGVEDDCPINNTTQFTSTTPEIYVTAVANNIPAGTTIQSRWIHNNEDLAVYNYTPDFDIERACIWFFVDQTDFEFTTGVYTVMLELNGTQAGVVTFTIIET